MHGVSSRSSHAYVLQSPTGNVQCIAVCSSSIRAETLGYAVSFSSPWRGKWRVFEWRKPVFMDQLQPSTNYDKLSDGVCRKAQPRHPPAGGGNWTPGQYALPERSGLAGSVGAVPGVSQFRCAPRQSAPAVAGARSQQRSWLGQAMAAVYPGDGSRIDRPRLVAQRGTALSGATVAPAAGSLSTGAA